AAGRAAAAEEFKRRLLEILDPTQTAEFERLLSQDGGRPDRERRRERQRDPAAATQPAAGAGDQPPGRAPR
ncbi:MAG: hypothetical protein AB1716_06900, partial [Planctomycetota bacterium]